MSFKLGNTSQQRLIGVHPDLVRVVRRAIELSSMDFAVNEGLRTAERQTLNSKHLKQADGFGPAVDMVPWGDFDGNGTSEISWHWAHYYPLAEAMRQAAKELGVRVRWGGCWQCLNDTSKSAQELVADYSAARRAAGKKGFMDGPHFELAA